MSTHHPLPLAVLVFLVGLAAHECEPVHADAWTDHEVALARICVSEATWGEADCRAIVHARGRYDVATLRRMHPRALASVRTDARRWIAGLDASLTEPAGWPVAVPWESRGRDAWVRVLGLVRESMRGPGACSEAPHVWGGRAIDADRIARLEARGFVRVDCGVTRNVFLRRGR